MASIAKLKGWCGAILDIRRTRPETLAIAAKRSTLGTGMPGRFAHRNDARKRLTTTIIPRHRVSPSASPMTGSGGGSSTPRLMGSIIDVPGILDPRLRGDDN